MPEPEHPSSHFSALPRDGDGEPSFYRPATPPAEKITGTAHISPLPPEGTLPYTKAGTGKPEAFHRAAGAQKPVLAPKIPRQAGHGHRNRNRRRAR